MNFDKLYPWEEIPQLIDEFLPAWVEDQAEASNKSASNNFSAEKKAELRAMGFSDAGKSAADMLQFLTNDIYPFRWRPNHPRYLSFIPGPFSPYSVLADFCNGMHNPYAAAFSQSTGIAILEEETLHFLAKSVGYNTETFGGQFTSGGSIANLTGMIVARDQKLPLAKQQLGRIYVSDQAHSSVAKAARMLGFLPEQVVKVATDDDFKIIPQSVEAAVKKDLADGYIPFMIVATAGTTNTGVVDPLDDLADIRDAYNLWLHVDGAYGATVALSSHKAILKGIERSDSLTWDGHKWLFQTYGCGIILVQDRQQLYDSFHTNPEYLKDVAGSLEEANYWDLSMEMTRPARGIKLWYTLQVAGLDLIRQAIDWSFELIDYLADAFRQESDWRIVSGPHMGIINVRFEPEGWSKEACDRAQTYLSQEALKEGYSVYITTELKGEKVIRFCIIHPQLTHEEVDRITKDLFSKAEALKADPSVLD